MKPKPFMKWRDPDLNRGHRHFQCRALPTELPRRNRVELEQRSVGPMRTLSSPRQVEDSTERSPICPVERRPPSLPLPGTPRSGRNRPASGAARTGLQARTGPKPIQRQCKDGFARGVIRPCWRCGLVASMRSPDTHPCTHCPLPIADCRTPRRPSTNHRATKTPPKINQAAWCVVGS